MTLPGRLSLLVLSAAAWATLAIANETVEQPNIVLVLVDDMGFADPGFIGADLETPTIDQLAAECVVFNQFYNNAK